MQKARYSTFNIGHYGLAFDYYTHFTSPIRRYPDLMVHRLLTRYLAGRASPSRKTSMRTCASTVPTWSRRPPPPERASIKYKQVEFMAERIGQVYDGTISGITEWGIYVEINENKCEGMIPMRATWARFLRVRRTPQQVLQVRLLEMPLAELEERVKNELIDNRGARGTLGCPGRGRSGGRERRGLRRGRRP